MHTVIPCESDGNAWIANGQIDDPTIATTASCSTVTTATGAPRGASTGGGAVVVGGVGRSCGAARKKFLQLGLLPLGCIYKSANFRPSDDQINVSKSRLPFQVTFSRCQ